MKRTVVGLVLACLLVAAAPAHAAGIVIGADGETSEAFGYTDAIREHVNIPVDNLDQDSNAVVDTIAIDIIRPAASGPGFKVPAIIDPSPYYTTIGRGNEVQKIADKDGDGRNDVWPLFLDNYFVPRGYAVILADMDGTGHSSGCPLQGGPGDIASMKAVVDWLNGRILGYDNFGNPVAATWHNGRAAMIGKSYDATLANGVAATGVAGLTTIVDESGISDWYGYSRMGGVRFSSTHYPRALSRQITNSDRWTACQVAYNYLDANDGDATGDLNSFWDERDYLPNVANVRASVLVSHGINDDNVRMDQMARWWGGLAAHGVPRKLWLSQEGHVDPFDYRRSAWVDTLHRWFDRWLWGIDNGIMSEPRVDIETSSDHWQTYSDWPLPGTANVDVMLHGSDPAAPGSLAVGDAGSKAGDSLAFTDNASPISRRSPLSEDGMIASPDTVQDGRLAFLSPPLSHDLHISGTPVVALHASLDTTQSNLAAVLVDYGDGQQVDRANNDGVTTIPASSCWGQSSTYDSACYHEVTERVASFSTWRITHGLLDSSNRDSLSTPTPVTPGEETQFVIPLIATDYDVPAGHRIGVVVMANDTQFPLWGSVAGTIGATVTVDTRASKVQLPVVGGKDAAVKALDATGPTARATVSGGDGWAAGPRTVTLRATDEPGGSGVLGIAWSKTGAETSDPVAQSGDIHEIDVAAEGVTTVHFHGIDNAGNSGPEETVDVKIDETAPVVSCASPDGSWHTSDVSLACTATDAGSGLADAGDAAFTLSTHVPAGTRDADAATDSHRVCDAAGNCVVGGPFGGNQVDLSPPTATADVSGGNGWAVGPRTVTLHATDDGGVAKIVWSKSGAEVSDPATVPADTATVRVTADGVTTIHFHATDTAGNDSPEQAVDVKVDDTAPVVSCAKPDNDWHAANVSLACSATDAESGLADAGDATFELSTHVPDGAHDSHAATGSRRVCDAVGNCRTAGPIAGNKVDLEPPSAEAHVEGTSAWARPPRTVTLRAADRPGGSGIASITWSLSGPSAGAPHTVDGDTATIHLATDGLAAVRYHATDVAGNASPDQAVGVRVDGKAPTVRCDGPDGAWHTRNVTLGCTASDDESGLADARDAVFTLSTNVHPGTRDADAATDSRRVCDAAGNCTTAGPIRGNRIDLVTPKHKPRFRTRHLAGATLRIPRTVTLGHAMHVRIGGPRRPATFTLDLRRRGHVVATAHVTLGHRVRDVKLRTRRLKVGTATLYVTARRHGHRVGRLHVRIPVRRGAAAAILVAPLDAP